MKRFPFSLLLVLAVLALLLRPAYAQAPQKQKPNIVVILVDDMGFSDLSCYGSEISTPNLDKLAAGGVRFTQFHNTARCCPSRTALLTGLYPHEAGVGHMTEARVGADGKVLPGYSGRLNDNCVTIAEALHGAGYFTAMTGKWHVGQNQGVTPWGRGFDRTLTSAAGGVYFPDTTGGGPLFYNGQNVGRRGGPLPQEWYSTDLWADFGLKFIDEAKAAKKPFFLYLANNAPHFPLQAPDEDIARWRGKFKVGWDKLRTDRYQRQIAMGIIDKNWPLSPRQPGVPAWDSLTPEQQDRYDHIMAIYAAALTRMDAATGRLIDGLQKRGELDNTVIMFMSDNGGNAESGINGRLEGDHPGNAKSTVFVGQGWATLNNTPFVRYKHYTDEGGIATPLIVHWPKGIATERSGKLETQPGHLIDIMPTCLDVAGATYPKTFNGHTIKPEEGVSLRPAFGAKSVNRAQPIFWEHEENRAVLDGAWKLVAVAGQPWRLYDTSKDRTEQNDLAAAQPDRVKTMTAAWDAYAARANVLPLGGWRSSEKGAKAEKLSPKKRFDLKNGDHLDRTQAPNIGQTGFTVTAKFTPQAGGGVIIAQGADAFGYALYVDDKNQLTFLTRNSQKEARVNYPTAIATGSAHTVVARLAPEGTLTLTLDGQAIASAKSEGTLGRIPTDGLDVGADKGNTVGSYTGPNAFHGTIESVVVELDGAGKRPARKRKQ